jgi:hypothetical protein
MTRCRPHPLALALAALALLPASAAAKEVVKAQVCGADACRAVTGSAVMDLPDYGPPANPPKAAAPFYTAELTMREDGSDKTFTFKITFVPKGALMRGNDGQWLEAPMQTQNAFKRAARGLEAFPASELRPLLKPTEARVVEVVRPPADPAPVDDGDSTWLIAALGLGGLGATWALARHVRRRRAAAGTPPAAPTPPAG